MLKISLVALLVVATVVTCENYRRDRTASSQRSIEQLGGFSDHGGRVIVLGGAEINDTAIEPLRAFPQIEHLVLAHSTITSDGLAILSELKSLNTLDLLRTPVTPTFCRRLATISKLKVLKLSQTSATDDCLLEIARIGSLEELDLSHCAITSGGIAKLLALLHLRILILSGTEVDDGCVAHLTKMPQLRRIDVDHTRITHRGLRDLHDAAPACQIGY